LVDVASRVGDPSLACDGAERETLGVVHAYGERDDVIPAIAAEAAEHGGTHYVLGGDERETELVTRGPPWLLDRSCS
jgi:hypothetical protein